jgi:hypothetical protein
LNELRPEWLSYFQLIQDLIDGATRRHIFSQWELDLLLDLDASRLRKSSRPEALRRYLRSIHSESGEAAEPLKFAIFMESENLHRRAAKNGS